MAFTYLTNLPLEQAKKEYLLTLAEQGFKARTERIRVQDAFGRVTARAVYAHINAPHYACSAMDGIALYARDSFGATETTPVTLREDQFVVVDTGDPIPDGCDAVIMVEELVRNDDGSVTIHAPAAPWQHIRQIGEDVCAAEMILPSFMEISPAAIGAMIAGGVLELEVLAKPVVGIIPTGDEIVPPCADPKPGDILEFNSSIFSAMLSSWGAEAKTYPIVPDKYEQIRDMLERAAAECDMVILNAGSSAGRDDYSAAAVREVGQVLCHGISIKPGKPAILGYKGAVPILGVPGYPVSGIIVIDELLRPLVDRWYRRESDGGSRTRAKLTRPVVSGLKYQEFVRVRMGYVDNSLMASPLPRGSGVVSSFMKADGIVEVPQGTEGYTAGEEIRVRLLTEKQQLKNNARLPLGKPARRALRSHSPEGPPPVSLLRPCRLDGRHYGRPSGRGARGGHPSAGHRDRRVQPQLHQKVFPARRGLSGALRGTAAGSDAGQGKPPWHHLLWRDCEKGFALCKPSKGLRHTHPDRLPLPEGGR